MRVSKPIMKLQDKSLLITGIGGFIGFRTAEIALRQGIKVRGLQRSPSKAQKVQELGAEVVLGSVTDPVAAQKACQGMDAVLHTAAIAKEGGTLSDFREVNVDGTLTMAKAARTAGVRAFVHLSSVMVYGFKYPESVTEEGILRGEENPYCQTKIESEQALLKLHDPPRFNIIIIRAGDVYGPGSLHWTVRPLLLMRKRLFILANKGRGAINHLYIDNLVNALFLALEKEAYGEVFNITDGQQTSWAVFFKKLADIAKLSPPISLPAQIVKGLIYLRCFYQKVIGETPDLLPESVDFITRPYVYSIAKARTQLGYEPTIDLEEGMQKIQSWLDSTDIFSHDVGKGIKGRTMQIRQLK
jgi:nucleoside-diphosphate-sugar epimerase